LASGQFDASLLVPGHGKSITYEGASCQFAFKVLKEMELFVRCPIDGSKRWATETMTDYSSEQLSRNR
jgi:hypothetical protein